MWNKLITCYETECCCFNLKYDFSKTKQVLLMPKPRALITVEKFQYVTTWEPYVSKLYFESLTGCFDAGGSASVGSLKPRCSMRSFSPCVSADLEFFTSWVSHRVTLRADWSRHYWWTWTLLMEESVFTSSLWAVQHTLADSLLWSLSSFSNGQTIAGKAQRFEKLPHVGNY